MSRAKGKVLLGSLGNGALQAEFCSKLCSIFQSNFSALVGLCQAVAICDVNCSFNITFKNCSVTICICTVKTWEGGLEKNLDMLIFFLLWSWKFKTFCLALSNSSVSVQFSNRTCQPTEFYCFVKMCVGTENFLTKIDPNLKWNVWLRLFIENTMKQLSFFFPLEKIIFKHLVGNPLQNRFMAWSLVHSETGGNFAVDFHVAISLRFSLQQEGLCDSLSGGINVTSKLLGPLQK